MVSDTSSLTSNVRAIIEDVENLKYLSIISLQELIIAFRTKCLLSNIWKNETQMIEFVLHDLSVVIDNIDEHVIQKIPFLSKARVTTYCKLLENRVYSLKINQLSEVKTVENPSAVGALLYVSPYSGKAT